MYASPFCRVQDPAPIVAALATALPDVLNASVGELNFKNVVNKLGDVMYTFPFSLPPYYTAVVRCLGVLEGVAIQVRSSHKSSAFKITVAKRRRMPFGVALLGVVRCCYVRRTGSFSTVATSC